MELLSGSAHVDDQLSTPADSARTAAHAPARIVRHNLGLLACALAHPTLCPLAEGGIQLLGLRILRRKDGHSGAAVERLEVLDQDDLGDLEEDHEADEDEEVAAPEVRGVETESLSDVVCAADGVLCWLGPKERAYLIWS